LDVVDLPPNIRALLETKIDSFEKLGLVRVLCAAARNTVALEHLRLTLHHDPALWSEVIEEATAAKLIAVSTSEVQLLGDEATLATIAELVAMNERDPLLVARALTTIAMNRIRDLAVRSLRRK
jgi:hypothetical protein